MLCGQGPEVALSSALASIQFWNTQQELKSQLMQQMLQKKIDKVQAACKRKLEEVHNGYVKVGAWKGLERQGCCLQASAVPHCLGGLAACCQMAGDVDGPTCCLASAAPDALLLAC
jgi:hypothetical protein